LKAKSRLERQRAAHFDDQLDVRRRIMSTSADLDAATRRIGHIKQDLERRIPTRGEAFYMQCGERRIDDRRIAGSFMLSKVRMLARGRSAQEIDLGEIGGFQFTCIAGPTWRETFEASLVMRRSNFDHHVEVSDDLTPAGLIARIEHLLERMPMDLQEQERKAEEAARRLTGYKDRVGQPFALQGELDGKLDQLAALESDLAQTAARPLAKAA